MRFTSGPSPDARNVTWGFNCPLWLWARIDGVWKRARVIRREANQVIVVLPRKAGSHKVHITDLRADRQAGNGADPRRFER